MKTAFASFTGKRRAGRRSRKVQIEAMETRLLLSTYSAVGNFTTAVNPNAPWSYGEISSSGFALDQANVANSQYFGAGTAGSTSIIALPSGAQTLQMQPGAGGTSADLRWTAPGSGSYSVMGAFASTTGGTESVHVDLNGTPLASAQLGTSGVTSLPISQSSVTVHAGDTIDFIVAAGTGGYSTLDQATLTASIGSASTGTNSSPVNTSVSGKLPTKSLVSGQRVTPFNQTVMLTNGGSTRVNGPVTINLELGDGPTGETGDSVVATISRRINLAPGKSIRFPILVRTLPANTSGTFYLVADVTDPTGLTSVGGSTGTITVAAPTIELTGAFRAVPAVARAAHNVAIPVIVSNEGNIQAKGTLTLDIVATSTASTVELGPVEKHILINPKGRQILLLVVAVPSDAAAGTYTLSGVVDPDDVFNSASFSGNTFASASPFKINA